MTKTMENWNLECGIWNLEFLKKSRVFYKLVVR